MSDIRPRPQVPVQSAQETTATSAAPQRRISAGDALSRTIFGGFWGLVSAAAAFAGTKMVMTGDFGQGLVFAVVAVLTGLYFQYLVRGGRFRLIAW